MTNQEIRNNKIAELGMNPNVRPQFKFELIAEDINQIQDFTRKDERDKVIWAIEKWVKDNKFFVHEYGDDVVDLSYLLTLLESLKP